MTKYSRRKFIKGTTVGMAALVGLPSVLWPKKAQASENIANCLVLGAGIAGLTAAHHLAPYKSVIVIEGSSRLGGRIHTVNDFTNGPIELGAEYIHMPPEASLLWQDIKKFGLDTRVIDKMNNGRMFHKDWKKTKGMIEAGMSWNPWSALWLFHDIRKAKDLDISAAEWITRQNYSPLGNDFAQIAFNGHLPAKLERLSLRGYLSDNILDQLNESNDFYIRSGYKTLINRLSQNLDVRTNSPIEQIVYDKAGVTVTTKTGEIFRAKTAICTFSVNMLKSGEIKFTPELPDRKSEALQMIEQGFHTKVVIEFTEKFWPEDMCMLHRIDQSRRAGRTYFHIFYNEKNRAPILTALICGPDAQRLTNDSDEVLLRKISQDIDEMYPDAAPTFSKIKLKTDGSLNFIRFQWQDDPFAKGGISYLSMEKTKNVDVTIARRELASSSETAPLFWAGEASATATQAGSVHGAHSTGLRAAAEVLALLS